MAEKNQLRKIKRKDIIELKEMVDKWFEKYENDPHNPFYKTKPQQELYQLYAKIKGELIYYGF